MVGFIHLTLLLKLLKWMPLGWPLDYMVAIVVEPAFGYVLMELLALSCFYECSDSCYILKVPYLVQLAVIEQLTSL